MKYGAPEEIRTPDPQIRRLTRAKRFQWAMHSYAQDFQLFMQNGRP